MVKGRMLPKKGSKSAWASFRGAAVSTPRQALGCQHCEGGQHPPSGSLAPDALRPTVPTHSPGTAGPHLLRPLTPSSSHPRAFAPPADTQHCLGTFGVVTLGAMGAAGSRGQRPGAAVQLLAQDRPTTKTGPAHMSAGLYHILYQNLFPLGGTPAGRWL